VEELHMAVATERVTTVSATVGGREITFESGKLAKQADGAVVVRSGETMVLATAQGRTEAREGADFFPLTVDVEERMYAAGKIPGGFFKREGGPDDGRGRRGRGSRGHAARGARARAGRDREAVRGAGRAPAPDRQAEVARPVADRRPRGAARRGTPAANRLRGPA